MYAVGRLISRGVYTVSAPFHPFGGAVDTIVVEQPDGSFKSSPWYVKFGKFQGVLKAKERVVNISINGVEAGFHMYLDHKGEAYFLKELDGEEEGSILSPPSSSDEIDGQAPRKIIIKSKSLNFDAEEPNITTQNDVGDGKIMARTSSRRSRIFGLVFGRKSSIKEDSIKGEERDDSVGRVSSMERAEIAADLLDVKWSTNLSTSKPDKTSRFVNPNMLVKEGEDTDLRVSDEQNLGSMENSFDPVFYEETGPCDDFAHGVGKKENSDCVTSSQVSFLRIHEEVEMYTLEASDLGDTREVASENSIGINKLSVDSAVLDVQNLELAKFETGPQASDESGSLLRLEISNEESRNERVYSYTYCETSDNPIIGMDNATEHASETLNFSNGGCEEVQFQTGNLYEAAEHLSEVDSQPEPGVLMPRLNLNDLELLTHGDSFNSHNKTICEGKGRSMDSVTKSTIPESLSVIDISPAGSDSFEAEVIEVAHDNTVAERLPEDSENQFQMNEHSYSCISSLRNSIQQEEDNFGKENERKKLHLSLEFAGDPQGSDTVSVLKKAIESTILTSGSLEEEQFLLSDIEDSGVQCKYSISSDSMERENHPSLTLEDTSDSNYMNCEMSSTSDKLILENQPNVIEGVLESSKTRSSPLIIPRSRKVAGEKVEWIRNSLPSIPSHIDNPDSSNVLHPLSQSLDLHNESSTWGLHKKDVFSSSKSDSGSESELEQEHPTSADTGNLRKLVSNKSALVNSIEMSLCKHLLYEGMGADAASQAFDLEKLDLEKFDALSPELVKDDKLVVRVDGRYFPWDVAEPFILGMTGCEQIFEPEGMIAVDRVEKNSEGNPLKSTVPFRGSWKLWPFSSQRSKTMNSVQMDVDISKVSDAENASESIGVMTQDKIEYKPRASRKERSNVPTSEQLASLDLKEGPNVITFTFSTSMLGKQQVDARIYLWKWNTRVVISDVDGTITKSDVLGQFMPLVGKDWSHTGVVHLFSAIQENGYQFLYLSARSISQAYLTRQFLFNLKQDGKALPNGPVVISPDGLFPSLYREVIRRAPHEFKIACLEDIRALFPPDCNPFYAGFGNRNTDEISYLKVGIPKGKIFTINPKGQVVVNRQVDTKSYTSLHALVNGMFPVMSSAEQEDFNTWNFWKVPVLDIDI